MIMADGTPKHPYHLVDPSPWPALGAVGALLLAVGAALGMHPEMLGTGVASVVKAVQWWIIAPGLVLILAVMARGAIIDPDPASSRKSNGGSSRRAC